MIEFILELLVKSSLLLLVPILFAQAKTSTSADMRSKIAIVVLCSMTLLPLFMMVGPDFTMISYSRARAETLGLDCSVGLMQRAERIVLLGLGSLIFGLSWDGLVISVIIVIFAVLTNTTAIHRILWVHQQAAGVPLDE